MDENFIDQITKQKEGLLKEIDIVVDRYEKLKSQIEAINTLLKNYGTQPKPDSDTGSETVEPEQPDSNTGGETPVYTAKLVGRGVNVSEPTELTRIEEPREENGNTDRPSEKPRVITPGTVDTSQGGLGDSTSDQGQSRHRGSIETHLIVKSRKIRTGKDGGGTS